ILKVGGCFSAKGVEVLLRDVAPQILRGTVDVRLDGVAIGALQARRDQRRAVQPVSEADIVIRLPNVGVRAEGGATENLLSTLLLLDVERSVRARQQRSVSAADSGLGADSVVADLLKLGVIPAGNLDRLLDCQSRGNGRIASRNLGGCLCSICGQADEKQCSHHL